MENFRKAQERGSKALHAERERLSHPADGHAMRYAALRSAASRAPSGPAWRAACSAASPPPGALAVPLSAKSSARSVCCTASDPWFPRSRRRLGVFSSPSYVGVGTAEQPAPYDNIGRDRDQVMQEAIKYSIGVPFADLT